MKKISNLRILDYIRTSDGEIGQVKDIKDKYVHTDSGIFSIDSIVDFDPVLSYIVQSGDYINGARVYSPKGYKSLSINGHSVHSTQILQMMTKQKFYKNCYSPNNNAGVLEWRVIKDFPLYQVSNTGLVMVIKTGKYMSYLQDRETLSVRLESMDGRRLRKSVAVLVLEAFVEEANGRIPKYKNGDNQNCRLENLEWETKSEQAGRVLLKSSHKNVNFKYNYIVGYYNGDPVIYALNTREMIDWIKLHCDGFNSMSMNHFNRSIRTEVPYKGILFKSVSAEEYSNIVKSVNIYDFPALVKKMQNTESAAVSLKKAKIVKEKVFDVAKQSKSKLDDIDDNDFFIEQESLRKQKFLNEMKARLGI